MKAEITDTACFRLRSSSLIELFFFDDVSVEFEEMKENLSKIKKLCKNIPMNQLIIVNDFTSFSMDALKMLSIFNQERGSLIMAEAVVVKSMSNKMMFRYYYNQNSNHYPLKLFENTIEAKCWLEALAIAENKTIE